MLKRAFLVSVMLVGAWLGVVWTTAFSQSAETTVSATVRIAASCLVVTPAAVDFGTVEFTRATAVSNASPGVGAVVSVRNCSQQSENVFVRGGVAGPASAQWAHAPGQDVCAGPNLFIQGVKDNAQSERRLGSTAQLVKTLAAGATEPLTLTFVPPCAGSAGAGQTITLTYTFTAVLNDQSGR
jgi:type 1 fimbria pilin